MSSLISIFRFAVVFQAFIVVLQQFFQWFAWTGDMTLMWRSDVASVGMGTWVALILTLGWRVAWLVALWRLTRGMAFGYVMFLIMMPLLDTIGDPARDYPRLGGINGLDVLFYMNGAFIAGLVYFSPLRRYFRVKLKPEPGSYPLFENPRTLHRTLQACAVGSALVLLLFGTMGERDRSESKPAEKRCLKCGKTKSAEQEGAKE